MNKKQKFFRRGENGGGDLADVNEQELAKDIETKFSKSDSVTEGVDMETDVSVVLESEKNVCNVENAEEKLPTQKQSKALPHGKPNTEAFEDREKTADGNESPCGDVKTKVKESRGYVYIFLIASCFLIAVTLVVFSARGNRDYETDGEGNGSVTDGTDVPNETVMPILDGNVNIYEKIAATSVGIEGRNGGNAVYLSGVGIFEKGYIATVYSSIFDGGEIEVTLRDGKVYPASVVGSVPEANLTLLKIPEQTALEYVAPYTGSCEVGDKLYAVGSAADGALCGSLFGCLVAYGERSYRFTAKDGQERIANVTQISGFDDEGMAGCPLFDCNGNAVAMTFATAEGSNSGFAVPLSNVKNILEYVKNGETPASEVLAAVAYTPAFLGIEGEQNCIDGIWGVEIKDFTDPSCDAALKLRRGDLIFRIDDVMIADVEALRTMLLDYASGQNVKVYVYRNGQKLSFPVALK